MLCPVVLRKDSSMSFFTSVMATRGVAFSSRMKSAQRAWSTVR